jgi:hypothetical protein
LEWTGTVALLLVVQGEATVEELRALLAPVASPIAAAVVGAEDVEGEMAVMMSSLSTVDPM